MKSTKPFNGVFVPYIASSLLYRTDDMRCWSLKGLRGVTDRELLAIPGIGRGAVERIRQVAPYIPALPIPQPPSIDHLLY